MTDNRRHFLVTGAISLFTILQATGAKAGLFHRRTKRVTAVVYADVVHPMHPCPAGFSWSLGTNPTIPDWKSFSQGTWHSMTVYGSGLATCANSGAQFSIGVSDPNYPSINWSISPTCYVTSIPGTLDSLTFSASETGSSPGSSTITITISTSAPYDQCPGGKWTKVPITYS